MFYFMYVVVGMYAYLLWFMGCFTYYFAFGVFYWGISSIYIYTNEGKVTVAAAMLILFSLTCPCYRPWTWRPLYYLGTAW